MDAPAYVKIEPYQPWVTLIYLVILLSPSLASGLPGVQRRELLA